MIQRQYHVVKSFIKGRSQSLKNLVWGEGMILHKQIAVNKG